MLLLEPYWETRQPSVHANFMWYGYELWKFQNFLVTDVYEALMLKRGSYLFCVCYRLPSGDILAFFFYLVSILDSVNKKCTIILGGDFNINLLADSSTKIDFEILLNSH